MAKYELLAAFANAFGLFAFISSVHKIFLTCNTESLTNISIITNLFGQLLLFTYAYINDLKGIMYPIYIFIIGLNYILYIKIFVNKEYN
jgi:hypothetical protein